MRSTTAIRRLLGLLRLSLATTLAMACFTAHAGDPAWPFDQPSLETLRASPKKVFAHYFPPFPLSLDNKSPQYDYYTKGYLDPAGEQYKHEYSGGYIRERPLPQDPVVDADWRLRNLEKEVRRAIAIGLDGFTVDILAYDGPSWNTITLLMQAAANVDPQFKIILMPDMDSSMFETGVGDITPESMMDWLLWCLAQYPSAYRLEDGRVLVAPYNAQKKSAAWWSARMDDLHAAGVDVALLPVFQGWQLYANDFKSISYGFSDWGVHNATGNARSQWVGTPVEGHQYVPLWMSTVVPQDMRPFKLVYREAINSAMYRKMWDNAIQGGADWVHIVSWNDYSETTGISPSTGMQYAYYDLTAYYIAWFKTGQPPPITRDVLYYFHRTHATSALPDLSRQWQIQFASDGNGSVPTDYIEVLPFLTAPGTVKVAVGTAVTTQDVPAGPSQVLAPLAEGTPQFTLQRDASKRTGGKGATRAGPAIDFPSAFPISNTIVYQDLQYRGGSSSRAAVPKAIRPD